MTDDSQYKGAFLSPTGGVTFSNGRIGLSLPGHHIDDVFVYSAEETIKVSAKVAKNLNNKRKTLAAALDSRRKAYWATPTPVSLDRKGLPLRRLPQNHPLAKYTHPTCSMCACCGDWQAPQKCCGKIMHLTEKGRVNAPIHQVQPGSILGTVHHGYEFRVQQGFFLAASLEQSVAPLVSSRCGSGPTTLEWACGTKGELADYMWHMHALVGHTCAIECGHDQWGSPRTGFQHTLSAGPRAKGMLRPTEPHHGFRCPMCSACAQHGWVPQAVMNTFQPHASPYKMRKPFMDLVARMRLALSRLGSKVYVTGTGVAYEKKESGRSGGLECIIPACDALLIVPFGERARAMRTALGPNVKSIEIVELPRGLPLRAAASVRLLAFYAARQGQLIVVGNRFITIDHAWSVGAVFEAAPRRAGHAVTAVTYSAST